MAGPLLSRVAILAVASAALVTGSSAGGPAASAVARHARVAAAAPLSVHVTLSKHRVRIGHRLRVSYTWYDGNGDLVDTNHVGTMAMHVRRDVPCSRTGSRTHPIGHQGSWWYQPQPEFTGAFTHAVKIAVGFNVRTGGCAPVEEATATEVVKVLPAR